MPNSNYHSIHSTSNQQETILHDGNRSILYDLIYEIGRLIRLFVDTFLSLFQMKRNLQNTPSPKSTGSFTFDLQRGQYKVIVRASCLSGVLLAVCLCYFLLFRHIISSKL